jgi:hypothetical protein
MIFKNRLFLFLILFVWFTSTVLAQSTPHEVKKRAFELTYQGEIRLPDNAKTADVWIPLAGSREGQKIFKRTIELPYAYRVTQEPVYKNEMIYFKIENPKKTIPFKIEYRSLVDFDLFKKIAVEADTALYLKPSRLTAVDEKIKSIAKKKSAGKYLAFG